MTSNFLKISEGASLAVHTAVILAMNITKRMSAKEIAKFLNASENHLAKILQKLAKDGYVDSVRGPGGGFKIAKKPDEINLLEIYESIEGHREQSNCLFGLSACGLSNCVLGGLVESINNQVYEYLSNTRLIDVVNKLKG